MNKQTEQLILSNFFSAYFHEDWHRDAGSPEAVIAGYIQTATPSDMSSLGQAIRHFSQAFVSDIQLEEKLFTELGCYYRPSGEGLSAKAWLEYVANQLLQENRS
jgi:hypothetical protein